MRNREQNCNRKKHIFRELQKWQGKKATGISFHQKKNPAAKDCSTSNDLLNLETPIWKNSDSYQSKWTASGCKDGKPLDLLSFAFFYAKQQLKGEKTVAKNSYAKESGWEKLNGFKECESTQFFVKPNNKSIRAKTRRRELYYQKQTIDLAPESQLRQFCLDTGDVIRDVTRFPKNCYLTTDKQHFIDFQLFDLKISVSRHMASS